MKRPLVLLLTHSKDHFTVDRVAQALRHRGAGPVRFDSDRFPLDLRLSARLGPSPPEHQLLEGAGPVPMAEVRAVWLRRLVRPALDPALSADFRDQCSRESEAALRGFLDGLAAARWVNSLARAQEASIKPRQLRIAREVGLRIPRTLITNDAAEARAFFDELEGRVVMKLLTALSSSMGRPARFLYTTEVQRSDLDDLGGLRHSPVVFQERIPARRELRVVWVAGAIFAGAIEWQPAGGGPVVDWRRAEPGRAAWRLAELPAGVGAAIGALMARLGLVYGAIDLICTPDHEHVFLEVNPSGEWGMLEQELGLPISEAIAGALLDGGAEHA